ncbi:MAG: hypothetical protein QOF28_501 [Actinomycetota bacterium]|jgi:hypothetical protein|nr:hypothetical protein [Actinomycetota bacterium]
MIVLDHDELSAVDAVLVVVPAVDAGDAVDALIVDVRDVDASFVDVRDIAPVVTGRGGALAQPLPEPTDQEIADPGVIEEVRATPRPDLRVAPDSYRRRRRVRIAAAAAAVSISATLFAVVGFNVVLAQNQIELQSLQEKLQVEQTRYYQLRNDVAQRSSPQNIVAKATALGLGVQQPGYLTVAGIKPPPVGPTETDEALLKASQHTGSVLDHPVP